MTTNIQVICRFRPLPQGQNQSIYSFPSKESVSVDGNTFTFDRVFCPGKQNEIYEIAAEPVIKGVLEGFNGTVVAYGQTASGKTHTMNGGDGQNEEGVIKRMVTTVFDHIGSSPDNIEYRMKISVVEIYMEKIRDLLFPQRSSLKLREDKARGVYIQDATEIYVSEEAEIYDLLKQSNQNRQISHTNMNDQSSRSHMIFLLTLTITDLDTHSAKSGKLFLVDLAGSEKISKTGAEGRTLDEAKGINKSLMALGQVIHALTSNKKDQTNPNHVPYRISKLTRMLQCSFGGNSRTNLIITCSQEAGNLQETLSTLRFGTIAKTIKNQPKINREYTVEELKAQLADRDSEILQLKEIIRSKDLKETSVFEQDQQFYSRNITLSDKENNHQQIIHTKQELVLPEEVLQYKEELKRKYEKQEQALHKKCCILEQNLEQMLRQFYEVIMSKSQWQMEYEILQRKVQYKESQYRQN